MAAKNTATKATPNERSSTETELRQRTWTAAEKLAILAEYESYPRADPRRGELLRRVGAYTSHLSKWREQRERGVLTSQQQPQAGRPAQERDAQQEEIARLEQQVARLQAELDKANLVIDVKKNCHAAWRGTDEPVERRTMMLEAAQELAPVVGVAAACAALGLPRSSFYQAQKPPRPALLSRPRPRSQRALSPQEQQTVRELLNGERFVDQAPRTIYATLLDEGQHVCSWRTMYRLLEADIATRERRRQRRRPVYERPRVAGDWPLPGVVLGHHQSARAERGHLV
jgi:hypothetical protein